MKGDHAMFKRAVHPGGILKDELEELGITPTEFARQIDVLPNRVGQIIAGKRSITGDTALWLGHWTALWLGHWFGTDPQFWLNIHVTADRPRCVYSGSPSWYPRKNRSASSRVGNSTRIR